MSQNKHKCRCGASFGRKSALENHRNVHKSGKRVEWCQYCFAKIEHGHKNRHRCGKEVDIYGKCPQQLLELYVDAKQKGYFDDQTYQDLQVFPQLKNKDNFSLQIDHKEWIVWKRIDYSSVVQGCIGNCAVLTYIQAMTTNPSLIKRMFKFWDKQVGFFVFQFFKSDFSPVYVAINARVPVKKTQNSTYIFSYPEFNQSWAILLEKAAIKHLGGIKTFIEWPVRFLHQFVSTITPIAIQYFKNDDKIQEIIDDALQNQQVCFLSTLIKLPKLPKSLKILPYHMYFITQVKKTKKGKEYFLRTCRRKEAGKIVLSLEQIKAISTQHIQVASIHQQLQHLLVPIRRKKLTIKGKNPCKKQLLFGIQAYSEDQLPDDAVLTVRFDQKTFEGHVYGEFIFIPNIIIEAQSTFKLYIRYDKKNENQKDNVRLKIIFSKGIKITEMM